MVAAMVIELTSDLPSTDRRGDMIDASLRTPYALLNLRCRKRME